MEPLAWSAQSESKSDYSFELICDIYNTADAYAS